MSRRKNIFWGVALLVLAVAMLAHKLGYLEEFRFWPTLLSIALITLLIKGIFKGSFGTILFSLAFLVIVNDKLLHLEAITPWPILGAALLGTIGLNMLFPGFGLRWNKFFLKDEHMGMICQESRDGGWFSYENVFNSMVKYISGNVEGVDIENAFGSVSIYFVDAQLPEERVTVNMDTAFGSVVLYVPASWAVTMNMERVGASVKEKGRCVPDGMNEMHINGNMVFGSVTIIHV